jgi:TAG lipase/steryl ester hydrolase/phospholipase A2/LPA acyltransferase
MFVVRGSIGRNKFGLLQSSCSVKLGRHQGIGGNVSPCGVCRLGLCCDGAVLPDEELFRRKCSWPFQRDAPFYGRTALLLSGGAALGFYHVGVVGRLIDSRI